MNEGILAKRLKELREERGYFQKFVADKLGIRSNTLSGYENGTRMPDPAMLTKIADLYNVSVDYLLGRTAIRHLEDIAAHRSDDILDSLPDEALKEIENFKEFIKSKYKQTNNEGDA